MTLRTENTTKSLCVESKEENKNEKTEGKHGSMVHTEKIKEVI